MNRREFTRGLASLGFAPALPTGAAPAAAAATATADHMYFVSWYTARLSKTCSAAQLQQQFNLTPSVAQEVFGKLVRTRTVSAPDIFGVGRTLDPLKAPLTRALASAPVAQTAPTPKPAPNDWLADAARSDPSPDAPVPQLQDACARDEAETQDAAEESIPQAETQL